MGSLHQGSHPDSEATVRPEQVNRSNEQSTVQTKLKEVGGNELAPTQSEHPSYLPLPEKKFRVHGFRETKSLPPQLSPKIELEGPWRDVSTARKRPRSIQKKEMQWHQVNSNPLRHPAKGKVTHDFPLIVLTYTPPVPCFDSQGKPDCQPCMSSTYKPPGLVNFLRRSVPRFQRGLISPNRGVKGLSRTSSSLLSSVEIGNLQATLSC